MSEAGRDLPETITHQRIRALMNHYGMTPSSLAEAIGSNRSHLRLFFKRSQSTMRNNYLISLSQVLNCTVDYLSGTSDDISYGERGALSRKRSPENASVLGFRIRHFRIKRSMSQPALAGRLGVTKAAVSAWEHGISEPNGENRKRLSAALMVDLEADEVEPEVRVAMEDDGFIPASPVADVGSPQGLRKSSGTTLDLSMQGTMARIAVEATVPWEIGVQIASLVREHALTKPA